MQQLLELIKRDREFKDGAPQKTLLMVFETLGGSGPLVSQYRSQLYKLLY
jgi:putative thioredoxin